MLNIARTATSSLPVLSLTGASGYNYLIQASTNLASWTPFAVVSNADGTVQFTDNTATNSSQRYYRALLP